MGGVIMATNSTAKPASGGTALPRFRAIHLPASLANLRIRHLELPLLTLAGVLLVASIALPYWSITLHAPQYPKGLAVDVYVYKMAPMRNVREVDGLNHYIGMIKLTDAAELERSISRFGLPLLALLAVASFWLRGRWRLIARLPIVLYPLVFVADLFAWLYYAGHSLDPHAALSSSIKEFTPRLFGTGKIGQFSTEASFGNGFYLAVAAAAIVLIATYVSRGKRDERA
jgi:hypothetical protein